MQYKIHPIRILRRSNVCACQYRKVTVRENCSLANNKTVVRKRITSYYNVESLIFTI